MQCGGLSMGEPSWEPFAVDSCGRPWTPVDSKGRRSGPCGRLRTPTDTAWPSTDQKVEGSSPSERADEVPAYAGVSLPEGLANLLTFESRSLLARHRCAPPDRPTRANSRIAHICTRTHIRQVGAGKEKVLRVTLFGLPATRRLKKKPSLAGGRPREGVETDPRLIDSGYLPASMEPREWVSRWWGIRPRTPLRGLLATRTQIPRRDQFPDVLSRDESRS